MTKKWWQWLEFIFSSVYNEKWTRKYIGWNIGSSWSWISTSNDGHDSSVGIGTQTKKYRKFKWTSTLPTKYLLSDCSAHVVVFNKILLVNFLFIRNPTIHAFKLFIYLLVFCFFSEKKRFWNNTIKWNSIKFFLVISKKKRKKIRNCNF